MGYILEMMDSEHCSVGRTVWPWRERMECASTECQSRHARLRKIAAVRCVAAILVGCFLSSFPHTRHVGVLLLCVGSSLGVLGLSAPSAFGKLDSWMHGFARYVGVVLNWVLLVPFFFVVMVSGHLILKLRSKDLMGRGFDPERFSYWDDCGRPGSSEKYERQY